VAREIREETGLDVRVEELLTVYRAECNEHRVYLCTPLSGKVQIGAELGPIALVGFGWYRIDDRDAWEPGFREDDIRPILGALQDRLACEGDKG
jgi:hypothetical protein